MIWRDSRYFPPDNEKYTWLIIPFGSTNAPSFFTCKNFVLQRDAVNLFYMMCNGVDVELHKDLYKQPDHIIALLSHSHDYEDLCSSMHLPDLVIGEKFTLHPPPFPIMEDTLVILIDSKMNVTRQK